MITLYNILKHALNKLTAKIMEDHSIEIAIRIITIKEGKILLVSNDRDHFFYLSGGKIESGETIGECIMRELSEETSRTIQVTVQRILYIHELINEKRHKIELCVLVDINAGFELEGVQDPDHHGLDHFTWVHIPELPANFFPIPLATMIKADFATNFDFPGAKYVVSH